MQTLSTKFSREQVAQHNTEKDCYVILHNKVYNVSEYLGKHPGGIDLVMKCAGKDCTRDFEAMYHSQKARKILEDLYIGDLQGGSNASNMLAPHYNNMPPKQQGIIPKRIRMNAKYLLIVQQQ